MNSKKRNVKRKHQKAKCKLCKLRRQIAKKNEIIRASGAIAESDLSFLKNQLRYHKEVKKFLQLRQVKSAPDFVTISIVTTRKLSDDERSRLRTYLRYIEGCPGLKFA